MTLRMVAGLNPKSVSLVSVRDPTGLADLM